MLFDEYGIMSLRFSVANLAIATLVASINKFVITAILAVSINKFVIIATLVVSINKFVIITTLVVSTNKFVILRTQCVRENLIHLKCPLCKGRLPTVSRWGIVFQKIYCNPTTKKHYTNEKVLTMLNNYYIL